MANYENIKDANSNRTPSERQELAKNAGKASGEARRRKADFRKTLNMLLTAEIDNEEYKPVLESLGVECTLESAILMAQIKEAMAGDTKGADICSKVFRAISGAGRKQTKPRCRYRIKAG